MLKVKLMFVQEFYKLFGYSFCLYCHICLFLFINSLKTQELCGLLFLNLGKERGEEDTLQRCLQNQFNQVVVHCCFCMSISGFDMGYNKKKVHPVEKEVNISLWSFGCFRCVMHVLSAFNFFITTAVVDGMK